MMEAITNLETKSHTTTDNTKNTTRMAHLLKRRRTTIVKSEEIEVIDQEKSQDLKLARELKSAKKESLGKETLEKKTKSVLASLLVRLPCLNKQKSF